MASLRKQRLLTNRSQNMKESHHIAQESLNRKSRLIEKYQNDMHDILGQIDLKNTNNPIQQRQQRQQRQTNRGLDRRTTRREATNPVEPMNHRARSMTKQSINYESTATNNSINDYSKLILGLEYALQNERKDKQLLQNKNISLETEISNLRNILVGPNQQKHYEKTVFKQYQDKIAMLENKIIDQKHNFEFIIDSKNEALASLEFELRTLQKTFKQQQKDKSLHRKVLQLMAQVEELRSATMKKNILIQRLKYMKLHQHDDDDEDSDDQAIKKKKLNEKLGFYIEQLQISNKLLLRKNIQILNLNKKTLKYEQILDVIEQYLDKKQVKNIDLNVLQHACINKLRLLLREKVVFQRQLLGQLNVHNKKISTFEQQILQRDSVNGNKIVEVINDNKRLSALVITLQNNIKNMEKNMQDKNRQQQILENQISINKTQFVQEIKRLKEDLNAITSVTKSQFDRMKIQNLKLSEQNRSLLFLVGQKQKQISKKGDSIKAFVQYKDKINNLNISEPERRHIQNASQDNPQVGSKLILINTFSQWMMQWNKVKNWNNKKVLLNVILDKQQIREDALKSMTYLINIIHQCMLSSKNIDIQERTIILLSQFVKHGIIKNVNLFIDKLAPIILRGFRQTIEGQDSERHRVLNQASLKILNSMQRSEMKWNNEMTNQMLSINGLKYLFNIITTSHVDELVQSAYNCLIMIAKVNQMISFMNSYNVTTILLENMNSKYPFLIYGLYLLKSLLQSRDYLKSQKNLLQFRKIFALVKDDEDQQVINLVFDCALILMDNTLFIKSMNKIETISILNQAIRFLQEYHVLKKIGTIYGLLISQIQVENMSKMTRQSDKLIQIISAKKFNENRFNRAMRILLQIITTIADSADLDDRISSKIILLYEFYDQIDNKTRIKMNEIINTIFQRNKDIINKITNEDWLNNLIQSYKKTQINQELNFLLKIMMFQHEQKRTTQILRTGRESLIGKLINDTLVPDYNVAYSALRNLLFIAKEKYSQKFINKALFTKFMNKVLISRNEQDFIGTVISILYFFCKNEETSVIVIQLGLVQKVLKVISERHDKENLVYKCLTLLELCHTTNYKRKILNYLLSSDSNLQNLKIINHILRKAKNKPQMGTRAVFLYDFLNGKTAYESLALLIEQNIWMVEDLVQLRNEYVQKVDPLVYKIELLLHNMSTFNAKVRKAYEKFKVAGDYNSDDDA